MPASQWRTMKTTLLLLMFVCFSYCDSDQKHPSDSSLEEAFRRDEPRLKQIVEMSRVDSKLTRIAMDVTTTEDRTRWPASESDWGISKQRWDEYRQLFRAVGLEGGVWRRPGSNDRYLIVSSRGLATGGSTKGYVYSEDNLQPLCDSLDDVPSNTLQASPNRTAYKKLTTNWYLFYEAN